MPIIRISCDGAGCLHDHNFGSLAIYTLSHHLFFKQMDQATDVIKKIESCIDRQKKSLRELQENPEGATSKIDFLLEELRSDISLLNNLKTTFNVYKEDGSLPTLFTNILLSRSR